MINDSLHFVDPATEVHTQTVGHIHVISQLLQVIKIKIKRDVWMADYVKHVQEFHTPSLGLALQGWKSRVHNTAWGTELLFQNLPSICATLVLIFITFSTYYFGRGKPHEKQHAIHQCISTNPHACKGVASEYSGVFQSYCSRQWSCVEKELCLVMVHTSDPHQDFWCKDEIIPAL